MPSIYVTERARTVRYTGEERSPMRGQDGQLLAVHAFVSNQAEDFNPVEKAFKPSEWNALLRTPGTVYRFRSGPYQALSS